jgi:Protein of unknown function (DUF1579)
MRLVLAAALVGAANPLTAEAVSSLPMTADAARQVIAMEAGTWDADITFPSNDASKPDQKAKGVQVNRLRSGGMWMLNEFAVDGTPYEGTGVWGYDRTTGRFSGIWTDNNDQQIRLDDGRWDSSTQTLTWTAKMVQPGGGWMVTVATEKFMGDKRSFEMAALSRKGAVPLVRMIFTKRPA